MFKNPKLILLIFVLVGISLFNILNKGYNDADSGQYLTETIIITDCISDGAWFGNESVGLHGFLWKLPLSLIFLITGPSVLISGLYVLAFNILTVILFYKTLLHIFRNNNYAFLGTLLLETNYVFLRFTTHYGPDSFLIFSIVLFIYFYLKNINIFYKALLILFLINMKEYIGFIMLGTSIVFLIISEIRKNKNLIKAFLNWLKKSIILIAPSLLFLYMMFYTSILPINMFSAKMLFMINSKERNVFEYFQIRPWMYFGYSESQKTGFKESKAPLQIKADDKTIRVTKKQQNNKKIMLKNEDSFYYKNFSIKKNPSRKLKIFEPNLNIIKVNENQKPPQINNLINEKYIFNKDNEADLSEKATPNKDSLIEKKRKEKKSFGVKVKTIKRKALSIPKNRNLSQTMNNADQFINKPEKSRDERVKKKYPKSEKNKEKKTKKKKVAAQKPAKENVTAKKPAKEKVIAEKPAMKKIAAKKPTKENAIAKKSTKENVKAKKPAKETDKDSLNNRLRASIKDSLNEKMKKSIKDSLNIIKKISNINDTNNLDKLILQPAKKIKPNNDTNSQELKKNYVSITQDKQSHKKAPKSSPKPTLKHKKKTQLTDNTFKKKFKSIVQKRQSPKKTSQASKKTAINRKKKAQLTDTAFKKNIISMGSKNRGINNNVQKRNNGLPYSASTLKTKRSEVLDAIQSTLIGIVNPFLLYLRKVLMAKTFDIFSFNKIFLIISGAIALLILFRKIKLNVDIDNLQFLSFFFISFLILYILKANLNKYLMPLFPLIIINFLIFSKIALKNKKLLILTIILIIPFLLGGYYYDVIYPGYKLIINGYFLLILILFALSYKYKKYLREKLIYIFIISYSLLTLGLHVYSQFGYHQIKYYKNYGYLFEIDKILQYVPENEKTFFNSRRLGFTIHFYKKERPFLPEWNLNWVLKDDVTKKHLLNRYEPLFYLNRMVVNDENELEKFMEYLNKNNITKVLILEDIIKKDEWFINTMKPEIFEGSDKFQLLEKVQLINKKLYIYKFNDINS